MPHSAFGEMESGGVVVQLLISTECSVTIDDLIGKSDYELFIKMCIPGHSLYHLLPPIRH